MAQIAYLHHEDLSRALVEAALQTREIGFTAASSYEELIIKSEGGSFYHFPSLERLDDHATNTTSGAKLIGFAPPAGMSSTDVQAAIEELKTSMGAGSLVGSGTAGNLVLWVSGSTIGNSAFLSEVSGRLIFNSDLNAGIYRYAANTLGITGQSFFTDLATFDGNINANRYLIAGISLVWDDAAVSLANFNVRPALTKNTTNTRVFQCIYTRPTINAGVSNTNTTLNLLEVDSINTSLTGVSVNLLMAKFGGGLRFTVLSDGQVAIMGSGQQNIKFYGLGDYLAANSESLEIKHDGSTAYIAVRKAGTGAYRDFQLLNNNAVQYWLSVAGTHTFNGPVVINNLVGGQPLNVQVTGSELFGIGSAGQLRLGGSGTTGILTATLTNSPKAGDPYTWYNVTIPGVGNGWIPVWMP